MNFLISHWKKISCLFLLSWFFLAAGCIRKPPAAPTPKPQPPKKELARLKYTIQVGAFRNLDNAVRLARSLNQYELDAYYFTHESGLYKVRFGDFPSRSVAQKKAEYIRSQGIIEEFYIVNPKSHAAEKAKIHGPGYIRNAIIERAQSFIGLPYQWGGTTPQGGFDCSGLTMAVYQLVGLSLPRSSQAQYGAGTPVARRQLNKGDLVFFATTGRNRVSHVGIYTGNDQFIHAPGKNKRIRTDSLSSRYFQARYVGARTYLQQR